MKFFKIFGIIISFVMIIAGIQDFISSKNPSDIVLIVLLCFFILFLIYRLIKPKKKVEKYKLNTPLHIKMDLRRYYNISEVPNEIRIIQDCIQLAKTSNNINTVLDRIELGIRKSYTLKELEQVGMYKQTPTSDDFLTILFDDRLKLNAIKRSYFKLLKDCENLKTETGKQNKKQKYFDYLKENDYQFSDDINNYIQQLKEGMV